MKNVKFTKMQGAGNDYVYINCLDHTIENASELAIKISDRHFGVGSDGLILILPSEKCDFRMQMFNSDGSEGEMCGNASRCIGKYVYDNGLINKKEISLETKAGIKHLTLFEGNARKRKIMVDMGDPLLNPTDIPVSIAESMILNYPITIDEKEWKITCVSMGNPHAVIFMPDIGNLDLPTIGPKFENHSLFPCRINTEFIKIIDRDSIHMRVWERGTGETLACGTGACAATVASVLNGYCNRKITVHLLGGDLEIEWKEHDNRVYMTGEAVTIFEGEISI